MKYPAPEPSVEHGWVETANRYPNDMLLRGHGFSIYSRPRRGQVLWVRDGEVYTQAEALALVRAALRKLARDNNKESECLQKKSRK